MVSKTNLQLFDWGWCFCGLTLPLQTISIYSSGLKGHKLCIIHLFHSPQKIIVGPSFSSSYYSPVHFCERVLLLLRDNTAVGLPCLLCIQFSEPNLFATTYYLCLSIVASPHFPPLLHGMAIRPSFFSWSVWGSTALIENNLTSTSGIRRPPWWICLCPLMTPRCARACQSMRWWLVEQADKVLYGPKVLS